MLRFLLSQREDEIELAVSNARHSISSQQAFSALTVDMQNDVAQGSPYAILAPYSANGQPVTIRDSQFVSEHKFENEFWPWLYNRPLN